MKVLCFGSLNIDYVYRVDHVVRLGETEKSEEVSVNCGGKGLNQSVALARAGMTVSHAGLVGRDGQGLLDKCAENGIQVDGEGNNSILLYGGANQCMTRAFIDEVLEGFEKDDVILLQNEINLLHAIIDKAYDRGMQIFLNPSPYHEALEKCDLRKISCFLLNEIEGEQMTGETKPEKILEVMHEKYPSAKIVLTLGKEGSLYLDDASMVQQEAFRVKAVDTTAAGDTFTGYFLYSQAAGMTPKEGLEVASKAAALTVTRHGAMDSIPTMEEVLQYPWEESKV